MYVNKVSNINFREEEKRYVSRKTMQSAQKLLRMMNNDTKYVENAQGTSFISDILASVSLNDKVRFADNRFLIAPTNKKMPGGPDSSLYIGKKFITFSSESGEIFVYKRGFFSTFRGFLSDIEKYISKLTESYNNSDVVSKKRIAIKGFTKKGLDILKNYTK